MTTPWSPVSKMVVMSGSDGAAAARTPLLFLVADTGGGHRRAAQGVGQSFVSPSTVKTHAARAMTKLAARDRAQLVVFAYEAGLVRPGWTS